MSIEAVFKAVNSFRHAFVGELTDSRQNQLTLLIEEGLVSDTETLTLTLGARSFVSKVIDTAPGSRRFLFRWPTYVAYLVTNELYGSRDSYELFTGHLARIYKRSRLLDYLTANKIATDSYPGPLRHIGFVSENHIVDVVSTDEPTIELR